MLGGAPQVRRSYTRQIVWRQSEPKNSPAGLVDQTFDNKLNNRTDEYPDITKQ